MNIFIDSDIILDLLLKRDDCKSSQKLFTMIDTGKIDGFTSPIVIANVYYIVSRVENKKKAMTAIRKIKLLLKILPVGSEIIDSALSSEFNDFEDAIQYYAAIDGNIDCIITRNKKDYKYSQIPVYDAKEFTSHPQD